jgi:hypothetical protein
MSNHVNDYNKIIDDLKLGLKLQIEVNEKLQQMDRPYLRGKAGLDKNVYATGVKDYSQSVGHSLEHPFLET